MTRLARSASSLTSDGFVAIRTMAWASPLYPREGGTNTPASPTVTRCSGRSYANTARPVARYSVSLIIVLASLNALEGQGSTPTSELAMMSRTRCGSPTHPKNRTVSVKPRSLASLLRPDTSGPLPATKQRYFRDPSVLRTDDIARTSSSTPSCCPIAPT